MRRLALLALAVLAACHPVVSVGYDTRSTTRGPLAALSGRAIAQRQTSAAATDQAAPDGGTYTLAVGGGARDFTISGTLTAHDVTGASFASPSDGSPQYLTGAVGLDFGWTWLRWKALSTSLHAGPGRMVVLDRASGERSWGNGLHYGAGVAVSLKLVSLLADLHRDSFVFDDGPATGTSTMSGLTIGVALFR